MHTCMHMFLLLGVCLICSWLTHQALPASPFQTWIGSWAVPLVLENVQMPCGYPLVIQHSYGKL